MEGERLSPEDLRTLWAQLSEAASAAEDSFDASVRTLAAGGVGLTVTLASVLKTLPAIGAWAAGVFLVSLGFNVVSYAISRIDVHVRLAKLSTQRTREAAEMGRWTVATVACNALAGVALVSGGVLLAIFIGTST